MVGDEKTAGQISENDQTLEGKAFSYNRCFEVFIEQCVTTDSHLGEAVVGRGLDHFSSNTMTTACGTTLGLKG